MSCKVSHCSLPLGNQLLLSTGSIFLNFVLNGNANILYLKCHQFSNHNFFFKQTIFKGIRELTFWLNVYGELHYEERWYLHFIDKSEGQGFSDLTQAHSAFLLPCHCPTLYSESFCLSLHLNVNHLKTSKLSIRWQDSPRYK